MLISLFSSQLVILHMCGFIVMECSPRLFIIYQSSVVAGVVFGARLEKYLNIIIVLPTRQLFVCTWYIARHTCRSCGLTPGCITFFVVPGIMLPKIRCIFVCRSLGWLSVTSTVCMTGCRSLVPLHFLLMGLLMSDLRWSSCVPSILYVLHPVRRLELYSQYFPSDTLLVYGTVHYFPSVIFSFRFSFRYVTAVWYFPTVGTLFSNALRYERRSRDYTLAPDLLPLPMHQRHVRTCRHPTGMIWMNKKQKL